MQAKKTGRVVVVGGGIAGMIAANYLAKAGKQTLVLEQNHQAGGNMSGFSRNGYYFDGGDQSFESLGIVFPILADLGVYDKLAWTKVGFRFKSPQFDFCVDSIDSVEAALCSAFPDEPTLKRLFAEVRRVQAFLDRHCSAHAFPVLNDFSLSKLIGLLPELPALLQWLRYEYREKLCAGIGDPALRGWLTGIGYHKMPFLFFGGFWNLWIKDYWHPVGGMQNLINVLVENFQAYQGEIRTLTSVSSIESKHGRVTGVRTNNDEFIPADHVVYAADLKSLLGGMVDADIFSSRKTRRFANAELTQSLVSAYLGLDLPAESVYEQLKTQHTFWFPDYSVRFPAADSRRDYHGNTWLMASFLGQENPGFAPPGKSGLVLQTFSNIAWHNYWDNGGLLRPRAEAYRKLKAEIGLEMAKNAKALLPGLTKHVSFLELGTPLSSERFSKNSLGASGGYSYNNHESPLFSSWMLNAMDTKLPNLTLAGHYVLWPGGVISAALSGRFAANKVLGKGLLSPLNRTTNA